jgi:predicted transcriptional regulator
MGEGVSKRGKNTITLDILEATLTPGKKMRIMYKANLNFERFNRYFYDLVKKGLIEEARDPGGKKLYRISEKGKTLLAALRQAEDILHSGER